MITNTHVSLNFILYIHIGVMLSRLPANGFFLLVNMTRKCHNHRLLIDRLYLQEGTRNTDIYNIIKVEQPALFLVKMIAELETN